MSVSVFDECTESCGWIAACICVLAFGSFGVPLKLGTPPGVHVHALVMQSYKTLMCFITCWFVLLLGVEYKFTFYGILSGLFWVPGSSCGIYGIRNAGLAVSVGTWSAITVLSSFVFGIIIFQERVKNRLHAAGAFLLLILGLIGMAKYSSATSSTSDGSTTKDVVSSTAPTPTKANTTRRATSPFAPSSSRTSASSSSTTSTSSSSYAVVNNPHPPKRARSSDRKRSNVDDTTNMVATNTTNTTTGSATTATTTTAIIMDQSSTSSLHETTSSKTKKMLQPLELEPLMHDEEDDIMRRDTSYRSDRHYDYKKPPNPNQIIVHIFGIPLTRWQTGILGAIINGAWGGMNLIPLHYATKNEGMSGADYLISYSIGSAIVNIVIWVFFFAYYYAVLGNVSDALEHLPKFHLEHLAKPGLVAGLLYSLGNFTSILAVTYLGQATGFSFCMMQLFVSGLWGVFYFQEIRGFETVSKWFFSAAVAILGIILLSYEHEGSMGH